MINKINSVDLETLINDNSKIIIKIGRDIDYVGQLTEVVLDRINSEGVALCVVIDKNDFIMFLKNNNIKIIKNCDYSVFLLENKKLYKLPYFCPYKKLLSYL